MAAFAPDRISRSTPLGSTLCDSLRIGDRSDEAPYPLTPTTSISTSAPSGSSFTATVERAG
jgi:hypothetical protein